jgi:hypothetical protein
VIDVDDTWSSVDDCAEMWTGHNEYSLFTGQGYHVSRSLELESLVSTFTSNPDVLDKIIKHRTFSRALQGTLSGIDW